MHSPDESTQAALRAMDAYIDNNLTEVHAALAQAATPESLYRMMLTWCADALQTIQSAANGCQAAQDSMLRVVYDDGLLENNPRQKAAIIWAGQALRIYVDSGEPAALCWFQQPAPQDEGVMRVIGLLDLCARVVHTTRHTLQRTAHG